MDKDLVRLKHLRDHILGVEMHLTMLQSDLLAVGRDIQFLEDLAIVLKENIQVLKTEKIIAIASEYKKAIEELKTVSKNLAYYTTMRSKLNRDFEKYTKIREDSIFEFENLKLHVDNRKVILLFDQSKRKK